MLAFNASIRLHQYESEMSVCCDATRWWCCCCWCVDKTTVVSPLPPTALKPNQFSPQSKSVSNVFTFSNFVVITVTIKMCMNLIEKLITRLNLKGEKSHSLWLSLAQRERWRWPKRGWSFASWDRAECLGSSPSSTTAPAQPPSGVSTLCVCECYTGSLNADVVPV